MSLFLFFMLQFYTLQRTFQKKNDILRKVYSYIYISGVCDSLNAILFLSPGIYSFNREFKQLRREIFRGKVFCSLDSAACNLVVEVNENIVTAIKIQVRNVNRILVYSLSLFHRLIGDAV